MAIFKDEQEVRNFFEIFLDKVGSHFEACSALKNSDLILQIRLTEPKASIKIDAQSMSQPSTSTPRSYFGEEGPEPDLTLEMAASTLDELWSGKKDIFATLISGKLKISGNMAKASRLVPLLKLIPPIYAETLAEFESKKTD
ncbi:MAG: SCP2 sterol-binding domain-containing protein [Candidatus Aminicenantes bacterium]|nr:SCP2 sterol-binding domain-containing protein [Candidatus Aminicenantes bacterium]